MFNRNRFLLIGHTTSLFLLVSYVICIGFGLLLPQFRMVDAWSAWLPGFEWLTPKGFLFGLVGSYLYGWYIAVLWTPLYGFFNKRYEIEK